MTMRALLYLLFLACLVLLLFSLDLVRWSTSRFQLARFPVRRGSLLAAGKRGKKRNEGQMRPACLSPEELGHFGAVTVSCLQRLSSFAFRRISTRAVCFDQRSHSVAWLCYGCCCASCARGLAVCGIACFVMAFTIWSDYIFGFRRLS